MAKVQFAVVIAVVCLGTGSNALLPLLQKLIPTTAKAPSSDSSGNSCTSSNIPVNRAWDNYSAPELINVQGFPNETHTVTTGDGYILTLHRIRNEGKQPIFLWHGILCSSRDWFMQRGNNSLPIMLYLAGYDVWMGNMRGNDYSKSHETLSSDQEEFWDFAYDEIAVQDVYANIDFILSNTGKNTTHCLGYSLGTTTIMAGLIRDETYQAKCKSFVGLAPVARNPSVTAPALLLPAAASIPEQPLRGLLNLSPPHGEFSAESLNWLIRTYVPTMCTYDSVGLCQGFAYALLGAQNTAQIDSDMSPRIYHMFPSTTSVRTYIQVIHGSAYDQPFQEYVFQSPQENQRRYNLSSASYNTPIYDLGLLETPTALFVGPNDKVAVQSDVQNWFPEVGSSSKSLTLVQDSLWGHLDFIWAIEACQKVYTPVIQYLKKIDTVPAANAN